MYHDCTSCLMYETPSACAACKVTPDGEFTGYRGIEDRLPTGCAAHLPQAVHELIMDAYIACRDYRRREQLINMLRLLGYPGYF